MADTKQKIDAYHQCTWCGYCRPETLAIVLTMRGGYSQYYSTRAR